MGDISTWIETVKIEPSSQRQKGGCHQTVDGFAEGRCDEAEGFLDAEPTEERVSRLSQDEFHRSRADCGRRSQKNQANDRQKYLRQMAATKIQAKMNSMGIDQTFL